MDNIKPGRVATGPGGRVSRARSVARSLGFRIDGDGAVGDWLS
jgi:hypothetical protein